jgi:hypothetical protein
MPFNKKSDSSQIKSLSTPANGSLIVKIKNGRLSLFLVADSDEQEALLLSGLRDAIITGDLWELIT